MHYWEAMKLYLWIWIFKKDTMFPNKFNRYPKLNARMKFHFQNFWIKFWVDNWVDNCIINNYTVLVFKKYTSYKFSFLEKSSLFIEIFWKIEVRKCLMHEIYLWQLLHLSENMTTVHTIVLGVMSYIRRFFFNFIDVSHKWCVEVEFFINESNRLMLNLIVIQKEEKSQCLKRLKNIYKFWA